MTATIPSAGDTLTYDVHQRGGQTVCRVVERPGLSPHGRQRRRAGRLARATDGDDADELGGDMNYVARTMDFEFPNPTYTGVEITCETAIERVEEGEGRTELEASSRCETEDGTVVLRGQTKGVILG